jgi:hypothetical protein
VLYNLRFALLSIILHGLVVYAVFHAFKPYESTKPRLKPVKSYILIDTFKAPTAPEPKIIQIEEPLAIKEMVPVETQADTSEPQEAELQSQAATPSPENIANPEVVKVTQTEDKINTIDIAPKLNPDIADSQPSSLRGVSSYIQGLHQVEVERLSEGALREYKEPKSLTNKSAEPNRNKELREASSTFAPKEANIIVLSEFGPNEKTILMDGKCIKMTTTELDDQFWKGPKLWTSSNGCGKYDKFNGQLQKSLDKYLKK